MLPQHQNNQPKRARIGVEQAFDAKPYGYLYAVVFETGAIKIGMSSARPAHRVHSHMADGKKFGVETHSTSIIPVYTVDTATREASLCALLQSVAIPTAGREWFKFLTKEVAVDFVACNMAHIEAESYLNRPTPEQIAEDIASRRAVSDRFMSIIYAQPSPQTNLAKAIESMLDASSTEDEKAVWAEYSDYVNQLHPLAPIRRKFASWGGVATTLNSNPNRATLADFLVETKSLRECMAWSDEPSSMRALVAMDEIHWYFRGLLGDFEAAA